MAVLINGSGQIGCMGSCSASVALSGALELNTALAALSGVIGTWGLIEQYKNLTKMTELAEKSADRASKFLDLANDKLNNIDIPTWDRMVVLYDRYKAKWGAETDFICEAFTLKAYCADYCLAEGRAVQSVQRIFDQSRLAKRRSLSRYETGRACHDGMYFAVQLAIAKTDAAMKAYNAEQALKLKYDKWYWQRWKDGAAYLMAMGNRAVNAITNGAAGLGDGLASVGSAVKSATEGAAEIAGARANAAQFWGDVADQGFRGLGYAMGAGYFNSTPQQTQTYTSLKDSPSTYVSYK